MIEEIQHDFFEQEKRTMTFLCTNCLKFCKVSIFEKNGSKLVLEHRKTAPFSVLDEEIMPCIQHTRCDIKLIDNVNAA